LSSDIVYITLIREKDKLRRYNPVMSTTNDRIRISKLYAFDPALNSLDGEVASFITSLIHQNAELAEKLEHIDSLTELAEKTVIEAGKEAERIKAGAEKEVNTSVADIVAGVEGRANLEAPRIIAEAKQISEHSMAEVQKRAEEEVLLMRKGAEQLLASSKQTAKSPATVSEELCATLNSDARIKAASMEEENESPEPPEPEAAICAELNVFAQKPVEEPSCSKEEWDENESPASYDDFVDLVLPPPISLDQMLRLRKHLKRNPGVKILDQKGSLDKGLRIRFIVQAHTPLLSLFEALSEVEKVSYEVIEVGKISLAYGKIPRDTIQHADGRQVARPQPRQ
jgi:vacuolar-type H+-ATPase subunit H